MTSHKTPWYCMLATLVLVSSFASSQEVGVGEGLRLMQQHNYVGAKKFFEAVLHDDDNNAEAHYRLGQIYLTRDFDDADEAVDQLDRATELNPNNADYYFTLGEAYGVKTMRASVIKQAFLAPKVRKAFEKAAELNPRHLGAHIGLAQYYSQAPGFMGGDNEKAWKEVDVVRSLDQYQGAMLKARMLEREKKIDDAEREYRTYASANSNDWRGWKNLGYFCLRCGKNDDALGAFTKYVELKADSADSYDSRAEALIKKNDLDRAESDLKKALSLDKTFSASISQLAQVYELKGKKKEARETYQWYVSVEKDEARRKKAEEKIRALR